jgi:glycosyltransferase involved in cell wall biosynthesis
MKRSDGTTNSELRTRKWQSEMARTLIRITTVPLAFKVLITGQPKFMHQHGFNVIMVSADGTERSDIIESEGCEHHIVPMTRSITPLQDIKCIYLLRKLFKKYKPDIVHTHTPKAGLLGMMAAKSAGVKIRIHTVAGLPLMAERGLKKNVLLFTEKLTYAFATNVWPNSRSLLNYILNKKLVKQQKLSIIGMGSSNGIELQRFSKQNLDPRIKNRIKNSTLFKPCFKILCVGRMVKDKGIEELINGFTILQSLHDLQLILIGPFEPELDPLPPYILEIIKNNADIIHISWSDNIEYYMDIADILVHPSHREGFPNVILQAGAMKLPVICSNIPGNNDIVRSEKTGLLFVVKSHPDMIEKIKFAVANMHIMEQYALTLFDEITELYGSKKVHVAILDAYNHLLTQHAIE